MCTGGLMKMDFCMERVGLFTNMSCNLNCKLCAADAPYRRNFKDFSLEQQKKVISRFFEAVSYVKKYSVAGGEPLLSKDLPALLDFLFHYSDRIGKIDIITNGTIVPKAEILNAAKKFGNQLIFLVDDYGPHLSTKLDEIADALTKAEIPFEIRENKFDASHCGGWVDFTDGLEKLHHSQADVEDLYARCAYPQKLKFCFSTRNGIMYPCDQVRRCVEMGILTDCKDDYINLLDENLSIEDIQNKIRHLYKVKSLSACAYCAGLCENSVRFPPAEQLTKEEIECVKQGARSYREVCKMMNSNKEHSTSCVY